MINTPPQGFQILQQTLRQLKREIIDEAVGELRRRLAGTFTSSGQISAGALGGTVPATALPIDTAIPDAETFGVAGSAGSRGEVSDAGHVHGMPANPVTAHEVASDPHTGYQKESEKGGASGYAGLDSSALVPVTQLGTGTPDGTKFLRDDQTYAVPTSSGIPSTLIDAKGDLLVGTADNTVARKAVGADDTILMADSAQTEGVKWVAPATPSTQAFGDAAAAGTGDTFTRGDHKHAMPTNPVTAHEAASDPHSGYVLESLFDAKGDLLAASADNTPAKLTAGSNGQILSADSGEATGLKWIAAVSGAHTIEEETTPLTARSKLSFQGAGVVATDDAGNDRTVVTISGGGSGAPSTAPYVTTAADAGLSAEIVIPGLAASLDIAGVGGGGITEEYDSATTGLTWTSAPDTEDSDTTVQSHLYVRSTNTAERHGLRAWVPGSGAFDARAHVTLGWVSGANSSVSLMITDSASTSRALILLKTSTASGAYIVDAYTYASSTYTQRGQSWSTGHRLTMRITRDGSNNVAFYVSEDGKGAWHRIASQSFTFTVAKIGYRVDGANPSDLHFISDWLRTDV